MNIEQWGTGSGITFEGESERNYSLGLFKVFWWGKIKLVFKNMEIGEPEKNVILK